jgi:hypothetical protein
MIMSIKIHNILDIIKISNSMELNKFFVNGFNKNVNLSVFYDFQSSMGPRKSRCDVFNATTQGQACPCCFLYVSNFFTS